MVKKGIWVKIKPTEQTGVVVLDKDNVCTQDHVMVLLDGECQPVRVLRSELECLGFVTLVKPEHLALVELQPGTF